MNLIHKRLKTILKLTRFILSLAVSFSALAGYVFFSRGISLTAFFVFSGVLFLAASASALNQYQERRLDALMQRTKDRPLPSRELKPRTALIISAVLGPAGFFILLSGASPLPAFLGLLNIVLYNAVYTPLKTKTRFAVLAGALTGAVPPLIGWTAAGGPIASPVILIIALFMYLWQIPHFLLIMMKYGRDYKSAGFLSLSGEKHIKMTVFIWILLSPASTLLFLLFHIINNMAAAAALAAVNIALIAYFYRLLFLKKKETAFKGAFRVIYLYQVIILAVLLFGVS